MILGRSNIHACTFCFVSLAVVLQSTEFARMQKRERPEVTDVKFVIRKNKRQLTRVRYLLEMKAVINKATKVDAEEVAQAGPGV